jgi:NADH-quinone oxidoreductase subunit H
MAGFPAFLMSDDFMEDILNTLAYLIANVGKWIEGLIFSITGSEIATSLLTMGLAAIILCTFAAVSFMGLTYAERKVVARIQDRIGPNQAGPFGLLVPIADGIKMFTKEDTTPRAADRWVYNIAPLIIATTALTAYAVIPLAPGVVGTNLNVGVIYTIAIGSGAVVAILMAGWGSNNKYALLGAFRTVSQLIGYEVPMLLNVLPVVMLAGSLSLIDIINSQSSIWYVFFLPVSALIFLISGIAETARSPFDLLEAESEIVAGFHVEYSGMKFALFFLGEYVNALAVAFIFATLFLGGYSGPIAPGFLWLLVKAGAVFTILMWLRGTLPRIRVDQMHDMNWKFFVPMSIVNLLTLMILGKIFGQTGQNALFIVPAYLQALIFAAASLIPFIGALIFAASRTRKQREVAEQLAESRRAENRAAVAAAAAGGAH